MGMWYTMVVKPLLIIFIVLILILIVFKGVGDGKNSLLKLFKNYRDVSPVDANRVTIIGTNPDKVWITKLDENYWQGIDDDKNCRTDCDQRCCFTIYFDREMDSTLFTDDKIDDYMEIREGLNYFTTPDNPGDWELKTLGTDYKIKLEGEKELIISGLSNNKDIMIRFTNGDGFKSKDGKPLNEDTRMIIFEFD